MSHSVMIKGGTLVDGTGAPARTADVLVRDGLVVETGRLSAAADEVVNAEGLLVTPGFVDIHTHYDGQVYWDPLLTPSSWHGATTVVMGNCGVGFAPVRPDAREYLIGLMNVIEDIPAETLRAGIPWGWESFAEYLDCLDRTQRAIDIGTLVPHGAVRSYVMGERGHHDVATAEELSAITAMIGEAIDAGALGCSGNRGTMGGLVPGSTAPDEEMIAIAKAVGSRGGIYQCNPNSNDRDAAKVENEMALLRRMSMEGGVPISMPLVQYHHDPDRWRRMLDFFEQANADGARLIPQVLARPLNVVMTLGGHHLFNEVPSFNEVAAQAADTQDLAVRLAVPEVRERILGEARTVLAPKLGVLENVYRLTDPPQYEPLPEHSIGAAARSRGREPLAAYYDALLRDEGNSRFLGVMANYAAGNSDIVFELIQHPDTIIGLGDGGGHTLSLCDASTPTTVLAYWVRDRTRGPRLPLELAIRELTSKPANAFGMFDRGLLTPGMRADINLIDLPNLRMGVNEFVEDLPANGRRMVQRASGYVGTYVAGQCILMNGSDTGARPGKTIRKRCSRN